MDNWTPHVYTGPAEALVATAGSATLTVTRGALPVTVLAIDWIATAGTVSAVIPDVFGEIAKIVINPGTPAPTALYDMLLNDPDGFDLLAGLGANLSATVTSSATPFLTDATFGRPMVSAGDITLVIAAAGAGGAGRVTIVLMNRF